VVVLIVIVISRFISNDITIEIVVYLSQRDPFFHKDMKMVTVKHKTISANKREE
jgi:hypothetical protein